MDEKRIDFHDNLCNLPYLKNYSIYYEPTDNIRLKYPCILYHFVDMRNLHADNTLYIARKRYQLTIITKEPDPETLINLLMDLPHASYSNNFITDELHHTVLYFYI